MTTVRSDAAAGATTFETFYARERRGLVAALTWSLGDGALAAEAVDEAFVRAYARWGRVGGYDNPAGWVHRVALNWARSAWRRRRRLVGDGAPDGAHHDREPADPELWEAVAALPPVQRDVVVLRFELDWSLEAIADAVDAPLGTVKSRLHRGLATLREQLEVAP